MTRIEALSSHDPRLIRRFMVDLSSYCNLKCSYCHQNRAGYPHYFIDSALLKTLIAFAIENQITSIDFTGSGEATLFPGWEDAFEEILDSGLSIVLITNLSKKFTDHELRVLSRVSDLKVSLDSADFETLRSIRRGADLNRIIFNIIKMRSIAIEERRPEPNLSVTVVFSAQMVHGLVSLVSMVHSLGINRINMQDFLEVENVETDIRSVWALTGKEAVDAVEKTRTALKLARELNLSVLTQGDFHRQLDSLEQSSSLQVEQVEQGKQTGVPRLPEDGETRNCVDPWEFVQILEVALTSGPAVTIPLSHPEMRSPRI